ncbi:putative DnaJ domain, Chaperone J-domain superfamily [Helianthus annuus]|uniref:DnaJ domain, Chaperone J-domain superfamily n=1 Tax=Helianthus annuus TaxID=4232 RepID=A0A251UU58_HELAN|nr:chaperone protein dnaJ 11, chloroplastic [Helianthus annuus]KAF5807524.1 putative DnaJ domain, Chaperone J-domain superfamily [Helianthus annuus]KAJ0748479.1 putative DnaJ domain, Chaperone J-domain superfamily [Helianthus annuus]KAJ0920668.1 putative DnaJ domain, Chaperone J-domain superfamily [Helianthus annuus]KAJ0953841.1 putative DnaJ domain, Chaperone J-domain superfamily [Helianthus annuus]
MAGTLTNSAGATSFLFLNNHRSSTANSTKSTSNLHIRNRNGNSLKASLHAVIDEPLVESTRSMSLYDVLCVKRDATACEIKSAYRSLAKRYHPDTSGLNGNGDRDFIEIRNAYVTLFDPMSRALYDLKLSAGFERRSGVCNGAGVYAGRRWETDQCW